MPVQCITYMILKFYYFVVFNNSKKCSTVCKLKLDNRECGLRPINVISGESLLAHPTFLLVVVISSIADVCPRPILPQRLQSKQQQHLDNLKQTSNVSFRLFKYFFLFIPILLLRARSVCMFISTHEYLLRINSST